MFNPYTKAVIMACVALLTTLTTAVEDGSGLTTSEIIIGVVAFIGGLGLVWAANLTVKWLVGGLTALLTSFAEAIQDGGISTQEYLVMAGSAIAALATVYAVANTPKSNAPAVVMPKKTPEVVV